MSGGGLAFTGLASAPLAIVGLVLTFSGWAMRKLGRDGE